jgi:hypothetical protein
MTANLIEMTIQIEKYSGGRGHQKRVAAVDREKEGKFRELAEDGAFQIAANQFIWEIAA